MQGAKRKRMIAAEVETAQGAECQKSADGLCRNGCNCHACHTETEKRNKNHIKKNVDKTAHNQIIQQPLAVPKCTENGGTDIVEKNKNDSGKVNAEISCGRCHDFFRRIQQAEHRRREKNARHREQNTAAQRQQKRSLAFFFIGILHSFVFR